MVAVYEDTRSLDGRMDDDGALRTLGADGIVADRRAHAYAVTAHRSQGSTVARAHALEDGGGRKLAYVKMSRARERSTVYAVADTLSQATEDLRRTGQSTAGGPRTSSIAGSSAGQRRARSWRPWPVQS